MWQNRATSVFRAVTRACSVIGVDLGDEQPTQHEIGNRTYIVAQVEPLDVDGVRTTEVGTALWLLAFLGPAPVLGRARRTAAAPGGCGPAWPASASASAGWSTAAGAARSAPPSRRAGMTLPPTRWELAGEDNRGYGETSPSCVAEGADVDGEARLADALAPRGARILDVGSGMGRVAAALQARGHHVVATEPDPALRAQSRATYPDLAVLPHEALALDPDELRATFDLVVVVGNVMIFLAEGTERAVLARVRDLLAPGGRVLVGFHLSTVKAGSRDLPAPTSSSPTPRPPGCASSTASAATSCTSPPTTTPCGCWRDRAGRSSRSAASSDDLVPRS